MKIEEGKKTSEWICDISGVDGRVFSSKGRAQKEAEWKEGHPIIHYKLMC